MCSLGKFGKHILIWTTPWMLLFCFNKQFWNNNIIGLECIKIIISNTIWYCYILSTYNKISNSKQLAIKDCNKNVHFILVQTLLSISEHILLSWQTYMHVWILLTNILMLLIGMYLVFSNNGSIQHVYFVEYNHLNL